jgi:hypothetical protein
LQRNCSCRREDGIRGHEVIAESLEHDEDEERPQVEAGQQAKAGTPQEPDETRDVERQSKERELELIAEEMVGAALAYVPRVDEVFHL